MKTITIKNADIKNDETASGALIDKVAFALGEWTYEELTENNDEYKNESQDYTLNRFDFEKSLIAYLNRVGASGSRDGVEDIFKDMEKLDDAAKWYDSTLLLGAYIALNYPTEFAAMLETYEEEMRDEAPSFYDSAKLETKCPELVAELQSAEDFFWDNLREEWLKGDRSSSGLLGAIRKHWQAASVVYSTERDELTLVINDEEASDLLNRDNGYSDKPIKPTMPKLKALIIDDIETGQHNEAEKRKTESAKRRAERERVAAYRAEQDKEAEARRRAELEKMTK